MVVKCKTLEKLFNRSKKTPPLVPAGRPHRKEVIKMKKTVLQIVLIIISAIIDIIVLLLSS